MKFIIGIVTFISLINAVRKIFIFQYFVFILHSHDLINVSSRRYIQKLLAGFNTPVTNIINHFKRLTSGAGCKIIRHI